MRIIFPLPHVVRDTGAEQVHHLGGLVVDEIHLLAVDVHGALQPQCCLGEVDVGLSSIQRDGDLLQFFNVV